MDQIADQIKNFSDPMSLIQDKIQNGDFENKLNYPTDAVLHGDPAYIALEKEQCQLQDKINQLKDAKTFLVRTMKREYADESSLKCANFKAALEEAYGLQNYSKRMNIWQKAWDDGHSGGWVSILNEYDELTNLVEICRGRYKGEKYRRGIENVE